MITKKKLVNRIAALEKHTHGVDEIYTWVRGGSGAEKVELYLVLKSLLHHWGLTLLLQSEYKKVKVIKSGKTPTP